MRLPEHTVGLLIAAAVAVFVLFHVYEALSGEGLPDSFSPTRIAPLSDDRRG